MGSIWAGKRVLITGASGFIGTHLTKKLEEFGAKLYVTEHKNTPQYGDSLYCDLRDFGYVIEVVKYVLPDYVFHLASQAIVGVGESDAYSTLETNVMGTINLLTALSMYRKEVRSVVVASTDKVMGRQMCLPYTEESPLLGTHQVYETSKVCEDVVSQMASYSWKLPIGITRFGNVYGEGDTHLSRIIPGVIHSYCQGSAPIIRSDGQHYRDFIHVSDVVDGYLRLSGYVSESSEGFPHIFNFGSGKPYRILDIVSMIRDYFPNSSNPIIMYGAKDEIEKQYVSGEKANQCLGWSPTVGIRNGIERTVDWYKERYVKSN